MSSNLEIVLVLDLWTMLASCVMSEPCPTVSYSLVDIKFVALNAGACSSFVRSASKTAPSCESIDSRVGDR